MLRRILGPLVFVLGLGLSGWTIYNLFIHRDPNFHASPIRAIFMSVAFVGVGWKWMQGQQAN